MKEVLFFISNFLDFWFLPFVIALGVSIVIEQIFRAQKKAPEVLKSMAIRKFLWRQNIILNFSWFLCYFILMFLLRGQQTPMPDMIWQG
tara:strand:+ start:60 stop:326 length:267 start_codon:yes stop_codon:yes gene_type:complete